MLTSAGSGGGGRDRVSEVIGQLVPLAVGIAVSPVPVIAVILMLLAPRGRGMSVGFLLGWVVGIAVPAVVSALLTEAAEQQSGGPPSTTASWVKVALGGLLLLLAGRQWRGRPRRGEPAELPSWMLRIDALTPLRATTLGFALAAVKPKNLTLGVAAGVAVGAGGLRGGGTAVALVVFVALAASSVAAPVLGSLVAADRLRGPLESLRQWLVANYAAVTAVLLLVIGAVLIGNGIGGLS